VDAVLCGSGAPLSAGSNTRRKEVDPVTAQEAVAVADDILSEAKVKSQRSAREYAVIKIGEAMIHAHDQGYAKGQADLRIEMAKSKVAVDKAAESDQ